MRRRYWVMIVALPVFIIAADFAYWIVASERLLGGVQQWMMAQRASGWTVSAGPSSIGGWPLAAEVTYRSLALHHAGDDIPGDLSWTSDGVKVSLSLLHPTVLTVSPIGPQHVSIGDIPDTILSGEEMSFTLPLPADSGLFLDLHVKSLKLTPAKGGSGSTVGLLSGHAEMAGSADGKPRAIVFSASAEAIALPASMKWPLGPNISSLFLSGTLNGPLPAVHGITDWADAWRDGGGSLEVKHFTIGWGPLGFTSSATLALDEQLQPMGSGSARLIGYAEALDRLAASGTLTKSAATVAKAVLSLMAGTPDSGTPTAVDVPLTLQYRTLSMRQVPLVRLPELDWPAR